MRAAVVNLKGGTAKSTSAMYLAAALARRGRTLLVDCDPQGSALTWAEDAEADGGELGFNVVIMQPAQGLYSLSRAASCPALERQPTRIAHSPDPAPASRTQDIRRPSKPTVPTPETDQLRQLALGRLRPGDSRDGLSSFHERE